MVIKSLTHVGWDSEMSLMIMSGCWIASKFWSLLFFGYPGHKARTFLGLLQGKLQTPNPR